MAPILPPKLSPGDEIRVISPARSMSIISDPVRSLAKKRLEELGLKVSFSKHCEETGPFYSSSVSSRLEDLHTAFKDPAVKGILTTIGGYNSIQLINELDYKLIRLNPKILCGYSDITTLQNAIFAKTGLATFSGPHFSTFGCLHGLDYTLDYFRKCLFSSAPFALLPSSTWSDDAWYLDQENRTFFPNPGPFTLHTGSATGTLIGGNIACLAVLQGTPYMPPITNSILLLEDDFSTTPETFDRLLHSLILQPDFSSVKALLIGRFQNASHISASTLKAIISPKKELSHLPIVADLNFGHTMPVFTFPIGGTATIDIADNSASIQILKHVS